MSFVFRCALRNTELFNSQIREICNSHLSFLDARHTRSAKDFIEHEHRTQPLWLIATVKLHRSKLFLFILKLDDFKFKTRDFCIHERICSRYYRTGKRDYNQFTVVSRTKKKTTNWNSFSDHSIHWDFIFSALQMHFFLSTRNRESEAIPTDTQFVHLLYALQITIHERIKMSNSVWVKSVCLVQRTMRGQKPH